ncbi:hypothetical protein FB45DRAFT_951936 [Roridomyces roridus]|uniref:Uncharacterized protein n=1 Tax=Roridomyces roridus TaxID=1738132 RepID=A0AAD7AZY0_9AGAR|nr:hypothetical protein FB45DRAFT_951936 [Roridomyces roridus]
MATPSQHALDIPELAAHTLSFVDSTADLHGTAFLTRPLLHLSQSRLFSKIELKFDGPLADARLGRLLAALESSPHLLGWITTLTIFRFSRFDSGHLQRLCNLAFSRLATRLVTLDIDNFDREPLSESGLSAVQQLLRSPALVSVSLRYGFSGGEQFMGVWEGCSQSIKHVTYSIAGDLETRLTPTPSGAVFSSPRGRIKLDSLGAPHLSDIAAICKPDVNCPFDVSGLRAFMTYSPMNNSLIETVFGSIGTIDLLSLPTWGLQDVPPGRFCVVTQLELEHDWNDSPSHDFSMLTPEIRGRIVAIRFHELHMTQFDLYTLDEELSGIHEFFPKLRKLHILFYPEDEKLREWLEVYEPSVQPEIIAEHIYHVDLYKSLPWYTSIV